jgi:hypothetical protein
MAILAWSSLMAILAQPGPAGAAPATGGPTQWGSAQEIPGTSALNRGGDAFVTSMACGSAGNCVAGGSYGDVPGHNFGLSQAFVADEVNGRWRIAIEVPGTAALNRGHYASVNSVSCPSAGNCAMGGYYHDRYHDSQAFVANEVNGRWHAAIEVPGTAALNLGHDAVVSSVSCGAPGECTAGGSYRDRARRYQAFVADEVDGRWHKAVQIPGTAVHSLGGFAQVTALSCPSHGNCAVGGFDDATGNNPHLFVASQVRGHWRQAAKLTGPRSVVDAELNSLSCPTAGYCVAGGDYTTGTVRRHRVPFLASEVKGVWRAAIRVPGSRAYPVSAVGSVSCVSPGNCAAGGYLATYTQPLPFVVSEVNGVWHTAIRIRSVAGLALYNGGVSSVACVSRGNCVAGGQYDHQGNYEGFLMSEVNGQWRRPMTVPGLPALNVLQVVGEVDVIACPAAGRCVAAGVYSDAAASLQVFVTDQG